MRPCFLLLAGAFWLAPALALAQEPAPTQKPSPVQERALAAEPPPSPGPPVLAQTPPAAPPGAPHYSWYGAPILLLDVAAVTMFHVGLATHTDALTISGAASYFAGSPVVHALNGEIVKGLAAMGIRAELPMYTFLAGIGIGILLPERTATGFLNGGAFGGVFLGATVGFELGIAGASAIDIGLLARKKDRAAAEPARQTGVQLAPTLTLARDKENRETPIMGLAGVF